MFYTPSVEPVRIFPQKCFERFPTPVSFSCGREKGCEHFLMVQIRALMEIRHLENLTPVTKSERLDGHHHVQSAAPATKSAFRSKTAPIPSTCHEKSTLDHQSRGFPSHLPRKVATMCENAHSTTMRAQSSEAPAVDTQILRACAVEMHVDDFARHECTVNSSELAVHARAPQRSKHSCLTPTARTPKCVHTVWVKKHSEDLRRHLFALIQVSEAKRSAK